MPQPKLLWLEGNGHHSRAESSVSTRVARMDIESRSLPGSRASDETARVPARQSPVLVYYGPSLHDHCAQAEAHGSKR